MAVVRELNAGRARRGPDGLALLDHVPDGPRRALVARLRMLREASGLTNEELVERLTEQGVVLSPSRLSKFLNGHEVPSRAQVTALHVVCNTADGVESEPDAVQETRRLLYSVLDAERNAKPLRVREFDLAEAQEQLERLRVRTAAELSVLRDELEQERAMRRQAEEALARLVADVGDRVREIGEITAERDAARQRIAELEERIRQHEALLRLHEHEARHLSDMAEETAREIVQYDSPERAKVPAQMPDAHADVQEIVTLVERLRDDDHDDDADQVLHGICDKTPDMVPDLWYAFRQGNRRLDSERLLVAAALHCDGVTLCRVWRTRRFGKKSSYFFREGVWLDDFVPVIASHTPLDELRRFVKACQERDESDALVPLARSCRRRPFFEVEALRALGLPVRRSLLWPLRAVVHTLYMGMGSEPHH